MSGDIKAQPPGLATRSDLSDVKAAIRDAKRSVIRWAVGSLIITASLTFTIARFVH